LILYFQTLQFSGELSEVTQRSEKPLAFFSEEIQFRLEEKQFSMEQKLQLLKKMPEAARRNVRELRLAIENSMSS
jgi:hypothetical protein